MGKASSSKKVARAALVGGSASVKQRRLAFPVAIAAILAVGIGLVVFARGQSGASAESPKPGEHWHAAYGVYVCNAFLPPVTDAVADKTGIHTHGDGVIHIHPFTDAYAGKKATLSVWGQTVGITFGDDSFTMPDGTEYSNGYDCNGQPAQVSIYKWSVDDPSAPPTIYTSDLGGIRLDQDRAAYTFAVVPEGTEVPKPESIPKLDQLEDVPGATSTTSTVVGGTLPATPGAGDPAAGTPDSSVAGAAAPDASATPSTAPSTTVPPTTTP